MTSSLEHYPQEYLDKKVTFFGRDFLVTPDVLIPRLETESLVRRAREILAKSPPTTVIDVGTGSGIIGTSIAHLAEEIIFLDISPRALEVAQKNFFQFFPDKKSLFIVSDLLENLPPQEGKHILMLANLPYVRHDDWENMSPDTRHEPRLALFGGKNTGFELYERFFWEIHAWASALGDFCILIEFGFDQRRIAEATLKKYPWKYVFFADYAGIERFAEISRT